jgi:limonene-1,2-epoxide hydrolase
VKRTAADGRVVIVERVDRFAVGGQSFALEAVGVYEIDSDGLIEFFRDYYQSTIVGQLEAAGFHVA